MEPRAKNSTASVHIGEQIKDRLAHEAKGRTVTWFAQRLNCHRVNVYDIFRRSSIDTELLWRISAILGHNFFRDIADEFDRRLPAADNEDSIKRQIDR